MYPPQTTVTSWEEIQARIEPIVAALNADTDLAIAAAVNPFLALEEFGIHVAPEARLEIEDRLRFSDRDRIRRRKLREAIFEAAGQTFDIGDAHELYRVLAHDLSLAPPPDEDGCVPPFPDTHPLPVQTGAPRGDVPPEDPLVVLEGRHPIIEPLLEYRVIDASVHRMAPEPAYQAIRRGERETGIRDLRIRFKGAAPGGRRRPDRPADEDAGREDASGRLDPNAASAEDLERLPGVGPTLAARIVEYREAHGRFATPEALREVSGIGDRLLDQLRPHLALRS